MATTPFYDKGRYVCEVVNQALGETGTGKPQFVLRFRVLGTPDPDEPAHYISVTQQYERTSYRVITDKTMPYFMEDLKILGYNRSSFRFLDPNTDGFHSFIGQTVEMFCNHENDQNGDLREKWGVARQSSFDVKPIETKKMRELDNLFGKHLKELESPDPQPSSGRVNGSATRPAQDSTAIDDLDIPF